MNFVFVDANDNMPQTHYVDENDNVRMFESNLHGNVTKDLSLTPIFDTREEDPVTKQSYFSQVWGRNFEPFYF